VKTAKFGLHQGRLRVNVEIISFWSDLLWEIESQEQLTPRNPRAFEAVPSFTAVEKSKAGSRYRRISAVVLRSTVYPHTAIHGSGRKENTVLKKTGAGHQSATAGGRKIYESPAIHQLATPQFAPYPAGLSHDASPDGRAQK
jgi:hypothetical protein